MGEKETQQAREILNRHYAYPSQKLAFKPCLDELSAALSTAQEWQPIETAPKDVAWSNGIHDYGPRILAFPVNGGVDTVEWWQSSRTPERCAFVDGGGNAAHPTHWMPLPDPPKG